MRDLIKFAMKIRFFEECICHQSTCDESEDINDIVTWYNREREKVIER